MVIMTRSIMIYVPWVCCQGLYSRLQSSLMTAPKINVSKHKALHWLAAVKICCEDYDVLRRKIVCASKLMLYALLIRISMWIQWGLTCNLEWVLQTKRWVMLVYMASWHHYQSDSCILRLSQVFAEGSTKGTGHSRTISTALVRMLQP